MLNRVWQLSAVLALVAVTPCFAQPTIEPLGGFDEEAPAGEDISIIARAPETLPAEEVKDSFSSVMKKLKLKSDEPQVFPIEATIVDLLPNIFPLVPPAKQDGMLVRNRSASLEYNLYYDVTKTPSKFLVKLDDGKVEELPWQGKHEDAEFKKSDRIGVATVSLSREWKPEEFAIVYEEDEKTPVFVLWPPQDKYYIIRLTNFVGPNDYGDHAVNLIKGLANKEMLGTPILDARAESYRLMVIDWSQLIPTVGGRWIGKSEFEISLPRLPGLVTARVIALFPLTDDQYVESLVDLKDNAPVNSFRLPQWLRENEKYQIIGEGDPPVLSGSTEKPFLLEIPAIDDSSNFIRRFQITDVPKWKLKFAGKLAYMIYFYEFGGGDTGSGAQIQRVRRTSKPNSESFWVDTEVPNWPAGLTRGEVAEPTN